MRLCFIKHGNVTDEWESLKTGSIGDFPDGIVPYIQEFAIIAGNKPTLVLAIGSRNCERVDGSIRLVSLRNHGSHGARYWWEYARALCQIWRKLRAFRPDLTIVLSPSLSLCVASFYHARYGGRVLPALAGIPMAQEANVFHRSAGSLVVRTLRSSRIPVILSRGKAPGRMVREKVGNHKQIWEFWPQYPLDRIRYRKEVEFSRDEKFRIFFVGRVAEEKGIFELLEMAVQLTNVIPSLHVVVIGDGPDREGAELRCRDLRLDGVVTFLGHKPCQELFSYFATGDILVVPTRASFPEGICKACIEGILGGLIPVASSVGGLIDNVDDGETGYLVPADRSDLFVDRILRLYRDPKLRECMRANAQKKREFFLNPPETLVTCVRRFIADHLPTDGVPFA